MVIAAKIFDNVIAKKKKVRQSKNTKKSWRKNIDLLDVELALENKEEDERLGVLGESTKNLFVLDVGDNAALDTTEDTTPLDVPLEYTIDTGTGLKLTGRPKVDKLLHAHRFLEGLPGAKPIASRSRFRMKDTLEHEIKRKESHLSHRNVAKLEKKQERARISLVLSKRQKKSVQKLSFDTNIWNKPVETLEDGFAKEGRDHARRLMGTKRVGTRTSDPRCKNIPATVIPHPGLSYNPTLTDHQQLLQAAIAKETRRQRSHARTKAIKTKDFPKGAEKVGKDEQVVDMAGEHRHTPVADQQMTVDSDSEEPPPPKLPKERVTHQQRLRQKRHKTQLREARKIKMKRKTENAVFRVKEFTREFDAKDITQEAHRKQMQRAREGKKSAPPIFFSEGDVEVSLGDELGGSLRTVQPTSNPVHSSLKHCYRRGLLRCKPRDRSYNRTIHKNDQIRKRGKAVDPFTKEFIGDKAKGV